MTTDRRAELVDWFTSFGTTCLTACDQASDERRKDFVRGLGLDSLTIAKAVRGGANLPDAEEDYITMRDT